MVWTPGDVIGLIALGAFFGAVLVNALAELIFRKRK
jgi:hypothetical protein